MEDSKPSPQPNDAPRIFVLRWGHRPQRDVRLTTHVALTARALCASGFILSDTQDPHIQETVTKITKSWGGTFHFEMGTPWKLSLIHISEPTRLGMISYAVFCLKKKKKKKKKNTHICR